MSHRRYAGLVRVWNVCFFAMIAALAGSGVTPQFAVVPTVSARVVGDQDRLFIDGFDPVPMGCESSVDLDNDGLLDFDCIEPFTPPDPSLVAPPIDQTVITDFHVANEFLYAGADPIQRGLAPGLIQRWRAAVIRGLVKSELGQPLAGVLVRVLDHPQYGYTYTRADGMFDLMVNGGEPLSVDYEKPGHLRAQRTVDVPWRDWRWVDDTVMIGLDPNVSLLQMRENAPVQVARGSVVDDGDGERRATMIVPAGTTAQMRLWDGSVMPLETMHFRASEYTVGSDGPDRMPGELPPTSGYTYAVEFSADEAIAARARSVEFSQPLAFYLENFLEFPVGGIVPTGTYDFRSATWLAEDNGRIVAVLSIDGGIASLDVDGSGIPASEAQLAELGIDGNELAYVAQLYSPGQSLWRVRVPHLTPWDCNWPYGPEPDDEPPPDDEPGSDADDPDWDDDDNPPSSDDGSTPDAPDDEPGDEINREDDADIECGSIIDCSNQRLGETIPVAGTGLSLVYSSERVPGAGRKPLGMVEATFRQRLTGSSVPARLKKVQLAVHVLGNRLYVVDTSPGPNQFAEVTWNEQDAYSRSGWQGRPTIWSRLSYFYQARYYAPAEFARAFANFGDAGVAIGRDRALGLVELARNRSTLTRRSKMLFGSPSNSYWDARGLGLGGWSLSAHHVFDPDARILFRGDGKRVSVGAVETNGIEMLKRYRESEGQDAVVLADGSLVELEIHECFDPVAISAPRPHGDDGDWCNADLAVAERIHTIAPDGTRTQIADNCNGLDQCENALWKGARSLKALGAHLHFVDEDGNVHRLRVDGGRSIVFDASSVGDCRATDLAHWRNSLSISCIRHNPELDRMESRIFRLDPDASLHHIAGGGNDDTGAGAARDAFIGTPVQIEFGPGGEIYIAEQSRVLKIDPSGIVTRVVGNGINGASEDGSPAADSPVGPLRSIAIQADGTLVFLEATQGGLVREVRGDGRMYTRFGGGTHTQWPAENWMRASGVNLDLSDERARVFVTPEGGLGVHTGYTAWRVPVGSFEFGSDHESGFKVPSHDGSELYEFDLEGRHLRTLHTLTGGLKYAFSYDPQGLLSGITDGDGNVLEVVRANDGAFVGLEAPFGQWTPVTLDPNTFLETVTSPEAQVWRMDYTNGGLLRSFETPRGFANTFMWQPDGRLERDSDPEGGFKQLERSRWSHLQRDGMDMITAEGNRREYTRDMTVGNARQRWRSDGNGGTSKETLNADYHRAITTTSGDTIRIQYEPDGRYGLAAPLPSTVHIEGDWADNVGDYESRFTQDVSPIAEDAQAGQFDLSERVTTNSRSFRRDYDAETRTWTSRTPVGRTQTVVLDAQQRPLETMVPGLASTRYEYDSHGRLERVRVGEGADERVTELSYDANGFLETVTDPELRTTQLTNDLLGRTLSQQLPDQRVIGFDYDANGNLQGIMPPGRPTHGFGFNRVDRATSYVAPDQTETTFEYNLDQLPVRVIRPGGEQIDLDYGSSGTLVRKLTLAAGEYDYQYDTGARTSGVDAPEQSGERPRVEFDWIGSLPIRQRWTRSGAGEAMIAGQVSYRYDRNRWMDQVRVRHGSSGANPERTFTYLRDADGLLDKVQSTGMPELDFSHALDNGLLEGSVQGQISDSWTYNAFAEPETYAAHHNGVAVFQLAWQRDKLGRITSATETVDGVTRTTVYSYDLAGRLDTVTENGVLIADYGFDANGNRNELTTPQGTQTAEHDDQDRLLRDGDCHYEWTQAGELETRRCGPEGAEQITAYNYDALSNLRGVELADGRQIDYVVDGLNRRIGKRVDGELQQGWLYLNQLEPVAELDGDGNLVSMFVYAERGHVPSAMIRDGRTYRILSDQVGSVRRVIDTATGEVVQRIDYDAFGNIQLDTNPNFQPFGFAGGLHDRDTGLVRFGARDYDPATGRWTSKDPIGFGGGQANLFEYSGGDPIGMIDPSGLAPTGVCLGREMVRQHGTEEAFYILARQRAHEWKNSDGAVDQALRNAEHYAWARLVVKESPNMYFLMVPGAFAYSTYKNAVNLAGSDRYLRTPGTVDEALAGALGADEEYNGLNVQDPSCACDF